MADHSCGGSGSGTNSSSNSGTSSASSSSSSISTKGIISHRPNRTNQDRSDCSDDTGPLTTTVTAIGGGKGQGWSLCRRPWWNHVSIQHHRPTPATSPRGGHRQSSFASSDSFSINNRGAPSPPCSILKALAIPKKRLRFEPHNKLYFPYEPGKQSTSAVRIKNISKTPIAFKFQTTAPKSCFMRPPNGVLTPGEAIIATVVKFIELPRNVEEESVIQKKRVTRDKFKIVSLKMEDGVEFTPELFDERKEHVAVEQILQVVLLNPNHPSPQLQKLNALLVEADAAAESRKKSLEQKPSALSNLNDINVLEEWRQRKLARDQAK